MAGEHATNETTTTEPTVSEPTVGEPTIIQTLTGESYVTHSETPDEALDRLSRDFLTQRLGNVVRLVHPIKGPRRDRPGN